MLPSRKACLEKPSTRQVTPTGILSAASSWTSGYIILGARRARSRPWRGAGSRSPARAAWRACGVRGSRFPDRRRRRPARGSGDAVLPVGDLQPPGETGLRDPEVPRDLSDRLVTLPGNCDHVAPELLGERLGHGADPSSEATASQAR